MNVKIYWILVFLGIVVNKTNGQTSFDFEGQSITPGTKQHFTVSISDQNNETTIPITVFHGKTDGPVLGITAGVHGYEYAPILAGQKLLKLIDPTKLTGTVVLVHVANVPSFLGRSPYTNPMDEVNLNRAFPGNPIGTITERIADYISQKVIARCDFFVDMHSGDAPEDLMAYAAYYEHDDFEQISKDGHQLAIHMGFDHIVIFKTTEKDYMKKEFPSLYCSAEAFKQGIPAVDVECGRLGIIEPIFVEKIVAGLESLLRYLKMIPGLPITTKGIAFIEDRTYQSSAHNGFFYPAKTSGDYVVEGMKIGTITDFFGETLDEVYAEKSGVILYMLGTPPIKKGETIVNIGEIKED